MIDVASGVQAVVQYVSEPAQSGLNIRRQRRSGYNSFADAIVANAASDTKKTDAALKARSKPIRIAPIALFAMHYFFRAGKGT